MPKGLQGFQKGNKFGKKFNTGRVSYNKGKPMSEEQKEKLRLIWAKRRIYTKQKCVICGKIFSRILRSKTKHCSIKCVAKATSERQKGKRIPWFKDYEYKLGKDHPNWNGGKSRGKHLGIRYDNWRKKIYEKDNYTCQWCGVRSSAGNRITLNAHHLKSWVDYPKLRFNLNNGITLCVECHMETHRKQREQQIKNKLNESNHE